MSTRRSPRAPRSSPRARAQAATAETPLTELEERFCREYLVDLVAGAAYHRARPQVTQGSAWTLGAALLLKPNVAARVAALQAERAARTEVTADRVVRELARVAFADQRTFAEWGAHGVTLRDSATLSADDAAAVAEVSQTISKEGGSIRFKLHDKVGALTLLGKHLGMFTEKVDVTSGGQPMRFTLHIGSERGDD